MTSLELFKTYNIRTTAKKYSFEMKNNSRGYYLHFYEYDNNVLFCIYNINQVTFTQEILGYYGGGIWPYCNTKDDCKKLLFNLLKKIENEIDPYISCDFVIDNIDCWDD